MGAHRERQHEDRPEPAPTPAPAAPLPAPLAPGFSPDTLNRAAVIALQRLVGNAAVAEMMQARERPEVRKADRAGTGRPTRRRPPSRAKPTAPAAIRPPRWPRALLAGAGFVGGLVSRYLSGTHDAGSRPSSTSAGPAERAIAETRAEDGTVAGQLRAAVAQRNGVVDGEREGRSSEAIAAPSRPPTRVALVQRSPWDKIKNAASDVWSGAKNLAGKAGDLIAKKIIGPLRDIAGGIGKAVSSLTSRFGKALRQAKPDFIDVLAPGAIMLKTLVTVRRDIYADAIAEERRQRGAANAAGNPKPGTEVEPGPLEKIDGVARSVEDVALAGADINRELVEGAILGDFKKNPSIWNTIGQVAMGFVPYAGQVADVRDLVADIKRLHENGWKRPGDWFDLVLTGIAFVPGVGDAVKAVGRGAKGSIKTGVKWIAKHGRALWSTFGRRLPALWKGLTRFGSTALKGVGSAAKKLLGKAGTFARGLLGRARGLAKSAGAFAGKVGERASAIAKGIGDAARNAASKARGLIGKLAGALPGAVRSVFDGITAAVGRGVKAASDGLSRVRDVVRDLKRQATEFLNKAVQRAADLARGVRERVGKMRQAAHRWIREKTASVRNKVHQVRKAGVRRVVQWLGSAAKSVKDRVVRVVNGALIKVRNRFRKWLETVPEKKPGETPDPGKRPGTDRGDGPDSVPEKKPGETPDPGKEPGTDRGDGPDSVPEKKPGETPDPGKRTGPGVDRDDRRDSRGRFTGGRYGADEEKMVLDAYQLAEGWPIIRQKVTAKLPPGTTLKNGTNKRFFDGLAEKPDGTYAGLEVKPWNRKGDAHQREFDGLISYENPAKVIINGKTLVITSVRLLNYAPRKP